MTDREPVAPADDLRPPLVRSVAVMLSGEPNPNALLDSVSRGDGLSMSVTIVTCRSQRFSATDVSPADSVRAWLARLPADLHPFAPLELSAIESATPAEFHAVAHAAACPDIFVIHAPEAHAGERVVGEVARFAAGRVLILSPDPAAVDRITERLASAEVSVVRSLADDENPARPSPVVARLTSVALGSDKVDQRKREAATEVASTGSRLSALKQLAELTPRLAALETDLAELTARRERFEVEARAATDRGGIARSLRLRAAQEKPAPDWISDLELLPPVREKTEAALASVREEHSHAIAVAAKKPGFLSRLFGKSKPAGSDPAEIGRRVSTLESEFAALDSRLTESRRKFESLIDGEWGQLVREKVAALRAQTDARHADLTSARDRLRQEIDTLTRPFGLTTPTDESTARDSAERELVAARERLAEFGAPDVARRLLAQVRVVVGTPGSLETDPVFHRSEEENTTFALLVLDRCEELTEADFARLARLAGRWLLVGDVGPRDGPNPQRNGTQRANGKHVRNGRAMELPFATRLARLLDRQMWAIEADRLVCRLSHWNTTGTRPALTCEPLLDRPEIELRFAADSAGEPVLAEVAFPAATTLADAKAFVFHQVGDVLLQPCGAVRWDRTPNSLTAFWPAVEHAATEGVWIDLEPGVREKVAGVGLLAFTAAVAFDPNTGWDAEKAEAWLSEHLPRESIGRLASLPADTSTKRRP